MPAYLRPEALENADSTFVEDETVPPARQEV